MARNTINCVIPRASPQSMEPNRKMMIETMKAGLRPYMSLNLPYSGAVVVEATKKAVTTQERCASPPGSPTMRGSAVATIF